MTSSIHYMTAEPNMPFSKREAYKLLDQLVHRVHSDPDQQEQDRANTGVIVGMLLMNDEIEVVVKFFDGITQYTKGEFEQNLFLYDE
jgi:hypothetical protein